MSAHLIRYRRLVYQKQFDESRKFYDLLLAGYGAGKTFSLVMKGLKLAALNHGMPGGLVAPTYKMFKRDVLPTIKEITRENGIPMRWKSQDSVIELPATGTEIYVFHAEDDGLSIRGPNLAFMLINEATLISKAAFQAALARVRLKNAKLMQVAMSGTPEGFNWLYDMFVAEPRTDADVFYGDMRLNPFVASSYADMLLSSYDDVMAQQYVGGKFVNLNSMAALHKFVRQRHVGEVKYEPSLPVWVSIDFNVNPMGATLWNRYPDTEKGPKLRAFDEVAIKGSDTYELSRVILEKCPGASEIIGFPDPAGGHSDTRSSTTDIEILEEKLTKEVRYKSRIISVRDCLNAANAFVGRNQILVDRVKCKQTIMDFEKCVLKPGTGVLDKSDLARTHWLDGFKNMIEYEFPINAKAGGWRTQNVR